MQARPGAGDIARDQVLVKTAGAGAQKDDAERLA